MMSAFNRRFDIKRIAGLQLPTALGLLGMLITGVLAMMVPLLLKLVLGLLFLISLATVIFVLVLGEAMPFRRVLFLSKHHANLTTSEHMTRL